MIYKPVRQGVYRSLVSLMLILLGLASAVLAQPNQEKSAAPVYQVAIDGVINPGALSLLEHAIDRAETEGAAALILRIDTPGGLLSTTRDMVSAISGSAVPVIGYVGPSGAGATSAGAFILLSCHVAIMNEGTTVGASSPVSSTGEDIDSTMEKKVMNDTRAFMRSIANRRGRNAEMAERFVTEAESLTAAEALEAEVIDGMVAAPSRLLEKLDGMPLRFQQAPLNLNLSEREIINIEPRLIDRVLAVVAHPQIAHLLISLGMLGLYLEFLSPGVLFPGVIGAIALILGLVGVQALPISLGFFMLLLFGLVLMFAEYFVAGVGVLGIGGAVAFVLGSLNLFEMPADQEHRGMVLSVSIGVSAALLLGTLLVTRSLTKNGRAGETPSIGKTGEAMVSFEESGYVLVEGRRWPATTEEPLHHGDAIEVTGQTEEGRLRVRRVHRNKTQG